MANGENYSEIDAGRFRSLDEGQRVELAVGRQEGPQATGGIPLCGPVDLCSRAPPP